MLIWIDDSVKTANFFCPAVKKGIKEIARAHERGIHFVSGQRDALRAISEMPDLDGSDRALFKRLTNNCTIDANIKENVSTFLMIVNKVEAAILMKKAQNDRTYWEAPITTFGKSEAQINQAMLLAEDLNDAIVYSHAAKLYMSDKKYNFKISLEQINGGGCNIHKSLECAIAKNERWCLCITDSDRISPEGDLSDSSKSCNQVIERYPHYIISHTVLAVREIENLIPISLLEKAVPDQLQSHWN